MSNERIEIVLARHGKPDLPRSLPRLAGTELADWSRRYNEAGISHASPPSASLLEIASRCPCIVASDLERSVQSAAWLARGRDVLIEPCLREACLPESIGLSLRLPPRAWVAIARVAWWLDLSASPETIAEARGRATRAAGDLVALAEHHEAVLVVGHGTFNRFIASRLRRLGWRGPGTPPLSYWSNARYVRHGAATEPSR